VTAIFCLCSGTVADSYTWVNVDKNVTYTLADLSRPVLDACPGNCSTNFTYSFEQIQFTLSNNSVVCNKTNISGGTWTDVSSDVCFWARYNTNMKGLQILIYVVGAITNQSYCVNPDTHENITMEYDAVRVLFYFGTSFQLNTLQLFVYGNSSLGNDTTTYPHYVSGNSDQVKYVEVGDTNNAKANVLFVTFDVNTTLTNSTSHTLFQNSSVVDFDPDSNLVTIDFGSFNETASWGATVGIQLSTSAISHLVLVIILIVVGGVVLVLCIFLIIFFIYKRKRASYDVIE